MESSLAKSTMEGLIAFDHPLGQIMEIVAAMEEGPEKMALKECCGTLLRHQFYLIEGIAVAHPNLRPPSER